MASDVSSAYSKPKRGKDNDYLKSVQFPIVVSQNTGIISFLALLFAVISLFMSISGASGISSSDKAELGKVAQSLREIQQKEIVLTSPLKTTVVVEDSFPITDILPSDFTLYIDETIPIDSQIIGRSNTGQSVTFNIVDDLRVRSEVPIDTQKSLAGVNVNINREVPIETRFSATLKVNAVYGKELNDIINRLETIADR